MYPRKLGAFLLMVATAAEPAAPQPTPPPPIGPPPASSSAPRVSLAAAAFPTFLEAGAEALLVSINDSLAVRSDVRGIAVRATEGTCDFVCVGQPYMSTTRHHDRPNERFVVVPGKIVLRIEISSVKVAGVWVPWGPARTLIADVNLNMFCRDWLTENGTFRATPTTGARLAGDRSRFESVLDFLLLPANLSRQIDAVFRRELRSRQDSPQAYDEGRCATLGIRGTEVRWDSEPPRTALGSRLVTSARVAITGVRQLSPHAASDASFTVYVNGRALTLSQPGSAQLTNGVLSEISGVSASLDLQPGARLQIIATDGRGQSAWVQYDADERYGAGIRSLRLLGYRLLGEDVQESAGLGTGEVAEIEPRGTSRPSRRQEPFYEILYRIDTTGNTQLRTATPLLR